MTRKRNPHWSVYLVLIGLFAATAALVVLQVTTANTATKIETALINVLQFLLSLAFAWLLTKIVTEQQFIESQRRFAIGAFRRIKEIERSLARTQGYLSSAEGSTDRASTTDLKVIRAAVVNAQDTVRSSIADWADIIGDEIEVANEIQRLKRLRSDRDDLSDSDRKSGESAADVLREINSQIESLEENLSPEIRVALEQDEGAGVEEAVEFLADQWRQKHCLEMSAFWEPSDTFSGNRRASR